MPRKEWIYRFICNIAYKQGDTFLVADIKEGGGSSLVVWAQSALVDILVRICSPCSLANRCRSIENRQQNENIKWEIWSYPLEQSTIVVLWNPHSRRYIMSNGNEQYVETDHGDEYDVKFHWYLEGADVKKPNDTIPVKYDNYGQHPKDVLICDS
ncbi:uncharacterized protein FMAN_14734 [Fusarium mangiferae]|uniref:Ricin B lectin domain-containing protein n=1 Tax=Fusarium mangiferae TaxID=192010 RepID=A0A1L7U4T9_FUSMA|nr:uncharacterized protein FMAN_14734 [Fusarium mangiferae]CVL04172.1 uncharacterized protein FMAN_14734 [Fusarium mangiferae]